MEDVNSLIQKLASDTPEEEKDDAMKKLQFIKDEDLHLLLQPISKAYWDGAAEVIINLGYPRVHIILPGLLEWIQDMNWPGAAQILDLLRDIGDPVIPYIKDVFNQHSDDVEWVEWIFELLVDNWNKNQILQIEEELIQMSKGRKNDIKALRTLWVHDIYQTEIINGILQEKKSNITSEIIELEKLNPGIDCMELKRGLKEVIFKPEFIKQYFEQNKARFSFCNTKSNLQNYLIEIDDLAFEVLNTHI
ncbi:MAG: DUF5071 domain-containing protein [Paenibacillus sp.]|nr:DUF5071 domain-containing protein [Paenibacillus sp.]